MQKDLLVWKSKEEEEERNNGDQVVSEASRILDQLKKTFAVVRQQAARKMEAKICRLLKCDHKAGKIRAKFTLQTWGAS